MHHEAVSSKCYFIFYYYNPVTNELYIKSIKNTLKWQTCVSLLWLIFLDTSLEQVYFFLCSWWMDYILLVVSLPFNMRDKIFSCWNCWNNIQFKSKCLFKSSHLLGIVLYLGKDSALALNALALTFGCKKAQYVQLQDRQWRNIQVAFERHKKVFNPGEK